MSAYKSHWGLWNARGAVLALLCLECGVVVKCVEGAESPPALGLLRGVESVRTASRSFRATLMLKEIAPPPALELKYCFEMDGDRRRIDVFPQGDLPERTTLMDGGEVFNFRRKQHEDVCIYDTQYAASSAGLLAFDPRISGLSDLLPMDIDVKTCLYYEGADSVTVVGEEQLSGVNVQQVKVARRDNEAVVKLWIEEGSFRVHRKVLEWPGTRVEIDSEYDAGNTTPFPSRVHIKRVTGGQVAIEREITTKSFEMPASIPPERFTMQGMDIPVNTAVVDYRIKRRIGYWNGEGLSENIVEDRKPAPARPGANSGSRLTLFFTGAVLLAIAIIVMLRRHSRSVTN